MTLSISLSYYEIGCDFTQDLIVIYLISSLPFIQVPTKGQVEISVDFKSRFLRECECTLVLVGKRVGSGVGSTMTFMLKGIVNSINPLVSSYCLR